MFTRVLLLFLLSVSVAPLPAVAARPVKEVLGGGISTELVPGRSRMSPEQAAREIQRRHGGRVLSVQADGNGYRVKMLKDGEVRIYQINP